MAAIDYDATIDSLNEYLANPQLIINKEIDLPGGQKIIFRDISEIITYINHLEKMKKRANSRVIEVGLRRAL